MANKITTLYEGSDNLYPRTKASAVSDDEGTTLDAIIEDIYEQIGGGGGGADLNTIYPVGSIYMSTNSTNPGTLFGVGTWEQIQNRFLLAAGSSYSAGSTGGSASHDHSFSGTQVNTGSTAITENQTASHRHSTSFRYSDGAGGGSWNYFDPGSNYTSWSNYTGGNQGHSHTVTASGTVGSKTTLPPYLAVYVWKRTA